MKNRSIIAILGLLLLVACSGPKGTTNTSRSEKRGDRESPDFQNAFFSGQQYKMTGDDEKAMSAFMAARDISPENDAVYYEIARIQFDRDQKEAALSNIRKAIDLNEENYWYHRSLADMLLEYSMFSEAQKELNWLIETRPDELDAYYDLAATFLYREDGKGAIETYNKLEERTGIDPELSLQKQRILMLMGEPEKAIAELDKLIEAFPDPYFIAEKARLLLDLGRTDEAKSTLEALIAKEPENGLAHLELSRIYIAEGKEDASWRSLQKAFISPEVNIDDKIGVLLKYFTIAQHDPKASDRAYELTQLLEEAHPNDPRTYSIKGDFCMQENDLECARLNFGKAVELDPARPLIWMQLLELDAQAQDWDMMLDRAEQAVELYPTQPTFYLMQGVAQLRSGKINEAITTLESGKAFVVDDNALKASFLSNLGEAYHKARKFTESDKSFEKSLELFPNDPFVLNNYAYYLSVRGAKLDRAAELSKLSNDLLPGTASFQDTYGWILFKKGDLAGAREWIGKAIETGGEDAVLLEHLGDVMFKQGETEGALEQWKRALELGGGSDLLPKKVADRQYYEED